MKILDNEMVRRKILEVARIFRPFCLPGAEGTLENK